MTRRADVAGLVSGLAIAALGLVLLLDALGEWRLGFGALAPVLLAVVGAILLAGGLSRRV